MKLSSRFFLLISIILVSMTIVCQNPDSKMHKTNWPPESSVVLENGSIPPGLLTALFLDDLNYDCITCNSQNRYGQNLKPYSKDAAASLVKKLAPFLIPLNASEQERLLNEVEDHLMWWMVRAVLIEGNNNNFGAIALKDMFWCDEEGDRHPLIVFRTSFTPSPAEGNSCYRTLLKEGKVKHVINLYDSGNLPMDDLVKAERAVAKEMGASYALMADTTYGLWREIIREHPEPSQEREMATQNVARLIKEQILMPAGEAPKGNILIHCGGGMHRTGMIIGILDKVINGKSMAEIEKSYRYHVGYKDEKHPGGFEQGNLDFIKEFKAEYVH